MFYGVGSGFEWAADQSWAAGNEALLQVAKVTAHGVVGGASSVASGGKFGAGALSALVPAGGRELGFGNDILSAALLGGTASVVGGGKFANGAMTGAMGYAFGNLVRPRNPEVAVVYADGFEDGFTTADQAAMAAYDRYREAYFALDTDQELVGGIIEQNGRYFFTTPLTVSSEAGTHTFSVVGAMPGAVAVAGYHTHPATIPISWADRFSIADHGGFARSGQPIYLRGPSGHVSAYSGQNYPYGRSVCQSCMEPHPWAR